MTAYKTYRHEYTEQDLDEYELIKTDPGIKRPPCPVCHADTYVMMAPCRKNSCFTPGSQLSEEVSTLYEKNLRRNEVVC